MNKEYRKAILSDIYEFQYGTGNTIENIGGDYPIYGSNGLVGFTNQYNSDNAPVIGHIGAYAGIVNWASGKHFVTYNGVICKIRKGVNSKFGYYTLLHSNLRKRLRGSTQPFISYDLLNDVHIFLPPVDVQSKIASILSTLDDKIESNNKINAELEAMAKTIYDYWFVQFDFPDAKGKPYKSSGGKMVWNAQLKRHVPEGWEVKSLFAAADIQYGFPFSTGFFNEEGVGLPVIRIRDILENSVSNYSTEKDVDTKYKLKSGDLLVGMDGNFHINYWSKEGCYLNQRVVRLRKRDLSNICLKYQVEPYIQLREKSVSRTTVGHLSDKDLKAIGILIPAEELRTKMNSFFDNLLNKIIRNQQQNQQLAQLRDWLLPMLMNGQVTVGAAYKQMEAVLDMAAEDKAPYSQTAQLTIPKNKAIFAKQVLAGKIVSLFKEDKHFTHIKFQKLQFLAEHIGEADLALNYYFQSAGPYDNRFMHTIFDSFKKSKWFDKKGYKFIPLEKQNQINGYYEQYFKPVINKFNKLFKLLGNLKESTVEIIATVYAVWNNRIILKQEITEELIITDFYNWSDRKQRYAKKEILDALNWLNKNKFEPCGFGKEIKKAKSKS